jgi:hypothetical protein
MIKQETKTGDIFNVTMLQGKGNRPIARDENGKICIIGFDYPEYVAIGSTWSVQGIEVHENKVIIKPLKCILTVAENRYIMAEKTKVFKTSKVRKLKAKKTFKYCTAQQLKSL